MKKRIYLSLALLLLLAFLTACGGGNQTSTPASVDKPQSEEQEIVDDVKLDEESIEDSTDNLADVQLFQTKVAELQRIIDRIDAGLTSALNRLELVESNLRNDSMEMELAEGLVFSWHKVSGSIKIPTGVSVDDVVAALTAAAEGVGSQILSSEVTAEGKTLVFGFITDGLEIVTHQYILLHLAAVAPKSEPVEVKAKLAFIIDDLGYTWSEFDRMMTIPVPMTFAVLPHLPESVEQGQTALQKGYDLILHLPMEPSTPNNPGEGAIYTVMTDEAIEETIARNLAAVPQGLIGANNHMGSKATSDERVMRVVLKFMQERKLFFVDSSTSPDSVVAPVAKSLGLAYGENRIFIDNVDELEPIKEQIRKAAKMALADGQAIAIGHVRNYTAKAILAMLDELHAQGIKIVFAKELLQK